LSAQKKKATEAIMKSSSAALVDSEDSEAGIKTPRSTRRQTRGANVRKSRYITGKNLADSESEAEATEAATPSSTSPRKRINSASAGSTTTTKQDLKLYSNGMSSQLLPVRRDLDGLDPIEQRKCPIAGCDSSGHLNGKMDRHFLAEACPIYHNITKKWCREFRGEISKKNAARKRALASLGAKSPLGSPSNEQKRHFDQVSPGVGNFDLTNFLKTCCILIVGEKCQE
jgi:histone acetyltransferase MYST2